MDPDLTADQAEHYENLRHMARLLARLNRQDASVCGQGYRRAQQSRQSKNRR